MFFFSSFESTVTTREFFLCLSKTVGGTLERVAFLMGSRIDGGTYFSSLRDYFIDEYGEWDGGVEDYLNEEGDYNYEGDHNNEDGNDDEDGTYDEEYGNDEEGEEEEVEAGEENGENDNDSHHDSGGDYIRTSLGPVRILPGAWDFGSTPSFWRIGKTTASRPKMLCACNRQRLIENLFLSVGDGNLHSTAPCRFVPAPVSTCRLRVELGEIRKENKNLIGDVNWVLYNSEGNRE